MAYGRERTTTQAAAPTQYAKFDATLGAKAYLGNQEVDRYNTFASTYKQNERAGHNRSQRGRRWYRDQAQAGLTGLYGQAQSNSMQAYADYRESLGAGSSKGTKLGMGQSAMAGPEGFEPSTYGGGTANTPYFGSQDQMGYMQQGPSRRGGGSGNRRWSQYTRSRPGGASGLGSGFGGSTFRDNPYLTMYENR
jgi:hypothetical protein